MKTSEDRIQRARLRMEVGNPPGKRGSLGDAINWLCLTDEVPVAEDLYLISADGDYSSALDSEQLHEFLASEWKTTHFSSVFFYQSLTAFFKDKAPGIQLAVEAAKDLRIQRLAASSNFAQTHQVLAQLSTDGEFTDDQARRIVSAAVTNSQVSWIMTDEDVKTFYKRIIADHGNALDSDETKTLLLALGELEPDDLPF